jgi:hypothetical protein
MVQSFYFIDNAHIFQLVSTPDYCIINFCIGLPGSQHDASAWQETLTVQQHDRLLEKDEWVWGDCAYPLQQWCQAPYKKWVLPIFQDDSAQSSSILRPEKDTPENATYNYHVSAICVRSEHCVGFSKGRWSSLKDLCLSIDGEEGLKYATY